MLHRTSQLYNTRCCAGTLKTKRALYRAAKAMVGDLSDRYSAFLEPGGFRAAIHKPTKAELDYMSGQAVGACLLS